MIRREGHPPTGIVNGLIICVPFWIVGFILAWAVIA